MIDVRAPPVIKRIHDASVKAVNGSQMYLDGWEITPVRRLEDGRYEFTVRLRA